MLTSILNGSKCRPIAKFESVPGLLEIRRCQLVQLQAVAGSEHQMIECAKPGEESLDRSFVGNVDHLTLCLSADGTYGLLNPRLLAPCGPHLISVPRPEFWGTET